MNKLRLGELEVESFPTSPEVKESAWGTPTYTVVGTCCGPECGVATATGTEE